MGDYLRTLCFGVVAVTTRGSEVGTSFAMKPGETIDDFLARIRTWVEELDPDYHRSQYELGWGQGWDDQTEHRSRIPPETSPEWDRGYRAGLGAAKEQQR